MESHADGLYFHYGALDCDTVATGTLFRNILSRSGVRGGVVVKALLYKPAGCGFGSRWCHWNFSMT